MIMNLRKLLTARDVTVGTPWKRLLELALPLLIGNIAQGLYNTVDTIVVGKYVGDNALSAVGAAGPFTTFVFIFFLGIGIGAGILVSQRFGAKDKEGLSQVIGNAMTITVIVSIVTTVFGLVLTRCPIFGGRDLLQILNTPEGEIYEWSKQYLTIIFAGVTGTIFYNVFAGCMRALGDSISALMFLLLACGINIVLDLFFVARLGMGVSGVAYATIIAQTISAICCGLKLFGMKEYFHVTGKELRLKKSIVTKILALGIPTGIGQGVFSMSQFFVQALTNSMGPVVMACNVVVLRIDSFAIMPYFSLGTAMTTYIGQNYGAKQLGRIEKGTKQGVILALCMSFSLMVIMITFAHGLAGIFTNTEALKDLAVSSLRILAMAYMLMSCSQTLQGYLRGIGSTTSTMIISMVTQIGARIPLAYYFARVTATPEFPNGQATALYFSLACAWATAFIITLIFYFARKKQLRDRAEEGWIQEYRE
ncbi:MAG: MATE family efflux transporter [Firmicutes bacterium]|nr:MATE family efflux transporter [Bacillota bacterium]